MPAVERDAPLDRSFRHSHSSSSSDQTRALIPMWDSSDPDRAPPPLPLNPQSPSFGNASPSRSGTSLAIQNAHAALTEKARETAIVPSVVPKLVKRMTNEAPVSPERALVHRSSPHKRMQSLQPGTVRDLSLMIEGSRDPNWSSPRASPERTTRPSTPTPIGPKEAEKEPKTAEKIPSPSEGPVPMPLTIHPAVRPSMWRSQQSILGENAPPQSATMLALHNLSSSPSREADPPLASITNQSNSAAKTMPEYDQLSGQILSLTSIATALQKEMAQLSRRSRDNATDLMSLKEATHARDEDIRKSLRELVTNVDSSKHHRDSFSGGLYLDNKTHGTSPRSTRSSFVLPRIPSPGSFAASIDRETTLSTPSLVGGDSPAVIALLEKIIREMGTRENQEIFLERLADLAERTAGMPSSNEVKSLIQTVKSKHEQQQSNSSVIPAAGGRGGGNGNSNRPKHVGFDDEEEDPSLRELDWNQRNGPVAHRVERFLQDKDARRPAAPSGAAELINDDVVKIIRSVKDSVSAGGGLTAEVKALVRELRGEVLGMGRDIGRKLDDVETRSAGKGEPVSSKEVNRIIDEALDQMKNHMNQLLREHRRSSAASTKSAVDYQEIYNAMHTALSDSQNNKDQPDVSREDIMQAVKDAWENYRPEIEVQQIGLERDEVLDCLREGLQAYAPEHDTPAGATRDEVFQAVVEGLKHFTPPQAPTPAALSRDEILEAVRECLEEFEFPVAASAMGNELSRDDMLGAVQEGLKSFEFPQPAAVVPLQTDDGEVLERLHDIMRCMQEEFQAISHEAKQNVAASGRDSEQLLDATKDGFEQLRLQMEDCINQVSSNPGQEDLMTNVVASFDTFRDDISHLIVGATEESRNVLKQEVEELRDAVNSSLVPHVPPAADNREALDAIREGLERVRQELLRPHAGTTDILDALHEGFSELRHVVEKIGDKPADLTANDEILDALKDGLTGVRTDIGALRDQGKNDQAVASLRSPEETSDAIIPTDMLKQDDIKNLEVMMTQLRIKVEAMEVTQPVATTDTPVGGLSKEDLAEVEGMLRDVRESVAGISTAEFDGKLQEIQDRVAGISTAGLEEVLRGLQESIAGLAGKSSDPEKPVNPEDAATKEDVEAIETILRNTKSRLEDMIDGEQAVRKDHIDAVEALVLETKDSLSGFAEKLDSVTRKDDLVGLESLVTQVNLALDEMKERAEKSLEDPEKVTKTDVDVIEAAVLEIKTNVEEMAKSDLTILSSKDDLKALEDLLKEIKENATTQAATNTAALDERQAEIVGVSERVTEVTGQVTAVTERVTEVKTFLEEFQGLVKEKLESGGTGIESLGKLLEGLSETATQNATVGTDLKEMFELMKSEFEESKSGVVGAKLDTDEKLQATHDALCAKLDEKIGDMMTKYDAFEAVMEERTKAGEARDVNMEEAVIGTKSIGEELKVLVDTLGSAVTDSLEKMEEASRTVFDKVEMLYSKAEDNHSDDKNEHSMTRDQVKQAITAVEGLQTHVTEYQPQILESVKDLLLVVGEHFEHSKHSMVDVKQTIEDAKPEPLMLPPIPDKYDDTEVLTKLDKLVEGQYDDSSVHAKLDKLSEDKYDDSEVRSSLNKLIEEKYDDAEVQAKLDVIYERCDTSEVHTKLDTLVERSDNADLHSKIDKIVDHSETTTQSLAQLETLDKVHSQVVQTAAEISTFLSSQRQRIADDHEDREKTLQETTIALERQRVEKDHVEASVLSLREEEAQLRQSVLELRAEKESLSRQRARLTGDVSSLETALRIRREELHEMDSRAEGLERRIMEGLLDHSRAFLLAKATSGKNGRDAMSRKRTPAARSSLGPIDAPNGGAAPRSAAPHAKNAVNMAMATTRASLAPPSPAGSGRRILSLSQITNNAPASGFKRSQSVRTPGGAGIRKGSWGGGRVPANKGYGDLDKENMNQVREIDEEVRDLGTDPETPSEGDFAMPEDDDDDNDDTATEITVDGGDAMTDVDGTEYSGDEDGEGAGSEAGTLRRSSMGTTVISATDTDGSYSGDEYDAQSEWTESNLGTESALGTESEEDGESVVGGGEVVVYAPA